MSHLEWWRPEPAAEPHARAVDPVCGKQVDALGALRGEFDGRIYFFCSPACPLEFETSPGSYDASDGKTTRRHARCERR